MYPVSIDLKKLSLGQRNKIVDIVRSSGRYFKLENQIIHMDIKTMKEVAEVL